MNRGTGVLAGVAGGLFGVVALIVGLVLSLTMTDGACGNASPVKPTAGMTVDGYTGEQLDNAAVIMNVAAERKLSVQAQIIGVAVAMGESSLRNLGYGDDVDGVTNPDGSLTCSLGLFQQQWCLPGNPWGGKEDVTNPQRASEMFFDALVKVPGWQTLPVTIAGHRVQGNADANHYAQFEEAARAVVGALAGLNLGGGDNTCKGPSGNYPPANGTEPGPWGGYENGRISESELSPIPWQSDALLRADATAAIIAMNDAFRAEFGHDFYINDGYRTYEQQVEAKAIYGDEAADPGTSNHGWAMAVDMGDQFHNRLYENNPIWQWLNANAGRFGWVNPEYMRAGGRGPYEPWHWEYYGLPSTTPTN